MSPNDACPRELSPTEDDCVRRHQDEGILLAHIDGAGLCIREYIVLQ